MRSLMLALLAFALLIPTASAQVHSDCICEREDSFDDDNVPSGTCGGGSKCFVATQQNVIPIVSGTANGKCAGDQETNCWGVPNLPCKFPSYKCRITAAGCAEECMKGAETATVQYTGPSAWPSQPPQTIDAEENNVVEFDMNVKDGELACSSPVYFLTVTVIANGSTVFEAQRRVMCGTCPLLAAE